MAANRCALYGFEPFSVQDGRHWEICGEQFYQCPLSAPAGRTSGWFAVQQLAQAGVQPWPDVAAAPAGEVEGLLAVVETRQRIEAQQLRESRAKFEK